MTSMQMLIIFKQSKAIGLVGYALCRATRNATINQQ